MAFDRQDKIFRAEMSNRDRWMAVRALGMLGDKNLGAQTDPPDLS
jgi:hypothetical protein